MSIEKNILEQEIFKQIDNHPNWHIDVNFVKWLTHIIIFKTSI